MRRTLIIVGIALALIGIASYLAWALIRPAPVAPATEASSSLFERLFPFNQAPSSSTLVPGSDQQPEASGQQPVPRLRKVSDKSVAGGSPFLVGTTTAVVIRFVERETGHVYETPADSSTVTRISNTTIPGIQKVLWVDADHFIATYLGDNEAMQNFYAALAPGKTEQSLQVAFLASFERAALDPTGKSLLTTTESASGVTFTLSKSDGTSARVIFTSPLASWAPLQSSKSLYAVTAPGSGIFGYLYQIVNGALQKVAGGIPGMLALPSPTGRYIALSSGGQNAIALTVLDTKTGTFYPSPLATLVRKCVWVSEAPPGLVCGVPRAIPRGAYPNDWLVGRVTFVDDIWGIEPDGGATVLLANPEKEAGVDIDLWQPAVAGAYVTFLNKRDLSFWSLKVLKEAGDDSR